MKKSLTTFIIAVAVMAGDFAARGTTYYWDNNSSAAGFGSADGIWGFDSLWSIDSAGLTAPAVKDTAADDDLHFGTDVDGLAGGTITVQGASQSFKTMRFGAASGGITLSGGTLNLASPSSAIMLNSAANTNTIGSVLAGSHGVQFKFPQKQNLIHSEYLTTSAVTVFTDVVLADYASASGMIGGGWQALGPAEVFYFSNNGITATYQLQVYDGRYAKCVKVELKQAGPDITARAVYARNLDGGPLGFDFDTEGYTEASVATSPSANGYGAAVTELFPHISTAQMNLTGCNTYSGDTIVSNVILRLDGEGQLGAGSYGGKIVNAGALHFNSDSNQVLSGAITGVGSLQKSAVIQAPLQINYAAPLPRAPIGEVARVIATNLRVADCIAAGGYLGGPSIGGGNNPILGEVFFFKNDGVTATWQLQALEHEWTKCIKVELRQAGSDITALVRYSAHINNDRVLGFDFDSGGIRGDDYQAMQTTLMLTPRSTLTLSGANSYVGGTIVDGGTLMATATSAALPETGGIIVNKGGELLLNVDGIESTRGSVGGNNPIRVNGGMLTIAESFNAGYSRPITIDGGMINSTMVDTDNANYMNNLTLMNGATIIGSKIRVGYESAPIITVSGTNTCSIPAGINMVKRGDDPLTFNVADVTGDATADLTVAGGIRDYNEDLANMPILKISAGTLSFSGVNTHTGVITIKAGALALDGNSTLNTDNPIVLNGGTLEMGAFTNSAGTLKLSSDSTVVLGTGRIAFANSSATPWNGDLTLTGTLAEKSVRFGTESTALTLSQLNAISWNGGSVRLDSDGYLVPLPMGTVIMVR